MTNATTDNDKNVSSKIVASTFQNEVDSEEVSRESLEDIRLLWR